MKQKRRMDGAAWAMELHVEELRFTRERNMMEFVYTEIQHVMDARGEEELDRDGIHDVLEVVGVRFLLSE